MSDVSDLSREELESRLEEVEEERDLMADASDRREQVSDNWEEDFHAARRRADRLEGRVRDLLEAVEANPDHLPIEEFDSTLNRLRSALDSREDEGGDCTCTYDTDPRSPFYGVTPDPGCPVHGEDEGEEGIEIASTEWQHGEDGSQKWRAECPCGWKGNWSPIRGDATSEAEEHREHCPVHADEPEGDERDVAAEAGLRPLLEMRPVGESEGAGNPPWKPTAENVRRWAEIRKKNGDYDAYTRLVVIARELEDRPPPTDEPVSREGEVGTFQTTRHLVPVTSDTVRCEVPWDWLDWSDGVHLDHGFADGMGRHREGYFHVHPRHAPSDHDPHGRTVRVRCAVGPADYWEQEGDPEEGYEPPPSSFRGEPIHEVTPAKDAHGMPWWIIVTRQDTGATHADARSSEESSQRVQNYYRVIQQVADDFGESAYDPALKRAHLRKAITYIESQPATDSESLMFRRALGDLAVLVSRRLSDAPSGEGERDG